MNRLSANGLTVQVTVLSSRYSRSPHLEYPTRRMIRQIRPASTMDWPLLTASALSVAAAVLVMALASYQGALTADPLTEFFQPVIPVIQ